MLPDITITGLDTSAGGDTSTEKITVVLETGEGLDYLVRWLADTDAVKLNARRVTALDELETRIESWTDTRAVEDIRFNCETCGSAERATSGFSDGCSQRCPPCWAAIDETEQALARGRNDLERSLADRAHVAEISTSRHGRTATMIAAAKAVAATGIPVMLVFHKQSEADRAARESGLPAIGVMHLHLPRRLGPDLVPFVDHRALEFLRMELEETKTRARQAEQRIRDLTGEVPR